jgi:N-dimethylarginine dimethylaminohydrolase
MPEPSNKPASSSAQRPKPAGTRPRVALKRALLMGRPTYFANLSARSGGPGDSRPLVFRGKADKDAALRQWQTLAEILSARGFDLLTMPADKKLPELVYAGAAGYLGDRGPEKGVGDKTFVLASLPSSERALQEAFERTIKGIGFKTTKFDEPFAGASDFFRCGEKYIFTPGADEESSGGIRLPAILGGPRRAAWGSSPALREEMSDLAGGREVVELRLTDPRFPRGDLICQAIGPGRSMLMVYVNAFHPDSRAMILARKSRVAEYIIPLSESDAAMYAANAFQFTEKGGKHFLVINEGVSNELLHRIEGVGITPIPVDLSAWIRKDRGGVRSMLCDLGWIPVVSGAEKDPTAEFRRSLRFSGTGQGELSGAESSEGSRGPGSSGIRQSVTDRGTDRQDPADDSRVARG